MGFYDEDGNSVIAKHSRRGVKQGCVLSSFFFCLTMEPVYKRLTDTLGPQGALNSYSDDAYLLGKLAHMVAALTTSQTIYKKVGLRPGWGPRKIEIVAPPSYELYIFSCDSTALDIGSINVFEGFSSCPGVPKHAPNDPSVVMAASDNLGYRHNRLLDIVEDTSKDNTFAALQL